MRALHLQSYSMIEYKGALNLFHCNGDSFATYYSNDMQVQSTYIKIGLWAYPKRTISLELLSHFSDGKLGMKNY